MGLVAVQRWSVQHKLMAALLLCLACFIALSMATGMWLTRGAFEERVVQQELPAVLGSTRADIQRRISEPLTASLAMADNHFLLQWERDGQPADGLAAFQAYAARLKARHRASAVYWVSQANRRYLSEAGVQRVLGADEAWFGRFLTSGRPHAMELARDRASQRYMLSVHARFDAGPGHAGLAGLALPMDALAEQVRGQRIGDSGAVMLVRPDGTIVVHRDAALADGGHALADQPGFHADAVATLLQDGEDFRHTVQPAEGGDRVLAASFVPELNLYLVATVPRAELLAAATRAAWSGPLIAGGMAAVLALLVLVLCTTRASPPRKAPPPPDSGLTAAAGEVRALAQRSAQAARAVRGLVAESMAQAQDGNQAPHGAAESPEDLLAAAESLREQAALLAEAVGRIRLR